MILYKHIQELKLNIISKLLNSFSVLETVLESQCEIEKIKLRQKFQITLLQQLDCNEEFWCLLKSLLIKRNIQDKEYLWKLDLSCNARKYIIRRKYL